MSWNFLLRLKLEQKVFIPKGNLASDYISSQLTNLGALVDEIIVYETYFPQESKEALAERLMNRKLDIITFTSPSTVDHFMEVVEEYHLSNDNITSCIVCVYRSSGEKKGRKLGINRPCGPDVYTVDAYA